MHELPAGKAVLEVFRGFVVDRSKSCGLTKYQLQNLSPNDDRLIQIFPEGTTANGEYMLRFHLGAFLSSFPVQLVAIRYHLWGSSRTFSNISYFHRMPTDWISMANIPFLTVDVNFIEARTLGSQEPRKFADEASFRIAEFLGIPVLDITSHAIFRPAASPRTESVENIVSLPGGAA
jgi:hypothetical protein